MTWVLAASGTQTATISTEHVLATDTNNATFVAMVDLANMANGDVVELRVYTIMLSGDALQQVWKGTYANAQTGFNLNPMSPFVGSDQSFKFTLKQTAGTGRNFKWKILRQ